MSPVSLSNRHRPIYLRRAPRAIGTFRSSCRFGAVLPVGIFGSVEGCGLRFGAHIIDVLAAPACGIGVVLDGPEPPIRLARHGILGDAPEEANLLFSAGADVHRLNQRVYVRRITFMACL